MKLLRPTLLASALLCLIVAVSCQSSNTPTETTPSNRFQGFSLLGDSLISTAPSNAALQKLEEAKQDLAADSSLDNYIWVGRFIGYTGQYREAIAWYSQALEQFPNESRVLRHRGHRYLSVREYGKAIADLERAAELIEGTENTIEPDGAPNPQGIPVSTRHGNIWYHLGLAYYLTGQYEKAREAYENCLNIELSNDDNLVSATHWLTLILHRLNRPEDAEPYLGRITDSLQIIENHSYWRTCQYYQGKLEADSLVSLAEVTPSTIAQAYGVAAYTLAMEGTEAAKPYYQAILATDSWASFGYLAAESDWAQFYE